MLPQRKIFDVLRVELHLKLTHKVLPRFQLSLALLGLYRLPMPLQHSVIDEVYGYDLDLLLLII